MDPNFLEFALGKAATRAMPACKWCLNWREGPPYFVRHLARSYTENELLLLTCPRRMHVAMMVTVEDNTWPCCGAVGVDAQGCVACAHSPYDQPWNLLGEDASAPYVPEAILKEMPTAPEAIDPTDVVADVGIGNLIKVYRYDWRAYKHIASRMYQKRRAGFSLRDR